jgi:hypothetical protein
MIAQDASARARALAGPIFVWIVWGGVMTAATILFNQFPESSRCIREVGHRLGNWFRGHSQSRVSPRMYVTFDGRVITPKIATKRQRTKIAPIGAAASQYTSVVNPQHRIGRPATQGVGAAA